ncbi:MAG: wax ester/triacylglycerol synthase family O-acyltransferase [Acidimicrobiales bacterium]|nr:wax ester/triacylglycerol synthase family O-acyltransferase [Acidimicrobiales bacterium]
MKRLSGTDALFLSIEEPNWHQHLGGLVIIDATDSPDFSFLGVRELMLERMTLTPKFMWKLHEIPLKLDLPIWVDDDDFDVDNHLHHVALPAPGGHEELAALTGKILSRQLDRRRPLWEMWFIEGLPNSRVALLSKFHHCLLDGMAGASLATVLFDFEPDADPPHIPTGAEVERAGPAPSDAELLARASISAAATPLRLTNYLARGAIRGATLISKVREGVGDVPQHVPTTVFNGPVGPKRRLAFCSVAMDDVKAVKNHYDVKVNDVVLAVCAGALRHYLDERGELPEQRLLSMVPVSTREEGDDAMDNKVATMLVSLATDIDDPAERLLAIHESSMGAKELTAAVRSTEIPSMGEVIPPAIIGAAVHGLASSGLMSLMTTVNTAISNVPGPPFPLYIGGARVTGIFSASIIAESMGLNITLFSYMDRVDFGLIVDPDLVPDHWDIADGFHDALAELMAAAELGKPTVVEDPFGNDSGTRLSETT